MRRGMPANWGSIELMALDPIFKWADAWARYKMLR